MEGLSRRTFCVSCAGAAAFPAACGAFGPGVPAYRSTLRDGRTPPLLRWAGREWRCNMGSTWHEGMDHCLRLAGTKARFEIRPGPDNRSSSDEPGKLRSELSGRLPGKADHLPIGVPLWGAFSFIHQRWADPAGMRALTGGVHGQVHMGRGAGGSPALAFRRSPEGLFQVTTRGAAEARSQLRYEAPLAFDRPHDVVYRLLLHPESGALHLWLDGRLVAAAEDVPIGSPHGDSFWILGCYYAGGAACPVVAEYANHHYPAPLDLSARAGRPLAWPG